MSIDFDQAFDECLDRLNSGESLETCLSFYPEFADELEPLLKTVGEFRVQSEVVPREKSKSKGMARLRQAIYDRGEKRNESGTILQRLFGRPKLWVPVTTAAIVVLIAFALALILNPNGENGLIPSPTQPSVVAKAGVLEIRVTDAPAHDISAVNMTIADIEVHRSGSGTAVGWETVVEGSRSFELLALRGVEEVLGSSTLEAGHYTQIRLNIEEVKVSVDGEVRDANLPSGKLKLVGSFEIEEGKTTALTLDFDAEKSVVVTGSGKVIFKPTVKLLVSKAETYQ